MVGSTLKKTGWKHPSQKEEIKYSYTKPKSRFNNYLMNPNEDHHLRKFQPHLNETSSPDRTQLATASEQGEASKKKRQTMLLKRLKSQSPRVNLTKLTAESKSQVSDTVLEATSQGSKRSAAGVPW